MKKMLLTLFTLASCMITAMDSETTEQTTIAAIDPSKIVDVVQLGYNSSNMYNVPCIGGYLESTLRASSSVFNSQGCQATTTKIIRKFNKTSTAKQYLITDSYQHLLPEDIQEAIKIPEIQQDEHDVFKIKIALRLLDTTNSCQSCIIVTDKPIEKLTEFFDFYKKASQTLCKREQLKEYTIGDIKLTPYQLLDNKDALNNFYQMVTAICATPERKIFILQARPSNKKHLQEVAEQKSKELTSTILTDTSIITQNTSLFRNGTSTITNFCIKATIYGCLVVALYVVFHKFSEIHSQQTIAR